MKIETIEKNLTKNTIINFVIYCIQDLIVKLNNVALKTVI